MAIQKNITIDGIEVPFKASAAVPRLYRLKFRRDIYKDFAALKTEVTEGDENKSEIGIERALKCLKISPTSWQNTLIPMFLITLMISWNSSTHSAFTKFFRSLSNSGD